LQETSHITTGTKNLVEDPTKYLDEAVPKKFTNIYQIPTTENKRHLCTESMAEEAFPG
jgi:hypothetical protein